MQAPTKIKAAWRKDWVYDGLKKTWAWARASTSSWEKAPLFSRTSSHAFIKLWEGYSRKGAI